MDRKRDGLLPIGEALTGLNGPTKKALQLSPKARHHFTQADQVNHLVGASEASPDLGFMTRLMALCSLPRTNPGNQTQYLRRNGPYTLIMFSSGKTKLPFGNLPRLLLAWVCTEAVRTQSRELILGGSVAEFMRKLDIYSSSGEKYTRLREQMQRLFNVHVQLIYEDAHGEVSINSLVADRTELWWNPKLPNECSLWESKVELGEKFFEEIISHPVPLDINTLKALKRSSLGLDWYLWLTYRVFSLKRPLRLTWPSLYRQFGVNPEQADDNRIVQDFRKDCLRELKKIKVAWPDLNYSTAKGVLILSPSKPSIAPTEQLSLVN